MAEDSRTVRVSGLPTDIDQERLIDKLSVHFLRSSNGGGEIDTVAISENKPDCALVHFEDSTVAQRVIQHGQHILKVDGKEYKLSVSKYRPRLHPDKIILSITATLDYSQIPEGRSALTRLQQDHPDVELSCDLSKKIGRLRGAYSKVQPALAQLLGRNPEGLHSARLTGSGQPVNTPLLKDPIKNHKEGGDKQDFNPLASEEDFSLMVDADVFQYLQKRWGQEYQRIQSQYGVDVVDVTNEGLTTLFLSVVVGGEETLERIKRARTAISSLYQESEKKIFQTQLSKTDLNPRGGLRQAMETIGDQFPKLLLSDDDCNVYIVGDRVDVSEAKQFLLQEHSGGNKEDIASLLRFPSYPLSANEEHLAASSGITGQQRGHRSSKMYHLAACPKDSGLTPLVDLPSPGPSSSGLTLVHEVRTEVASEDCNTSPSMRRKNDSVVRELYFRTTLTPPSGPGTAPKRTESFSGAFQQGGQKTEEDSSALQPRTSSLSTQKEYQELYRAEMLVPTILWRHMVEAYSTQVKALTLDVQIKDETPSNGVQTAISISGAEPSAMASCQQGLQQLVDSLATDFCVQELRLSELGITDPEDETLQACCAEVGQRFSKISVRVMKRSLYLLGSKRLCAQVGASLRDLFCGDGTQTDIKDAATPLASASCPSTSVSQPLAPALASTSTSGPSAFASCPSTSTSCPSTSASASTIVSSSSTSTSSPSIPASCPLTSASRPSTSCPTTFTSHPSTSASSPSTSALASTAISSFSTSASTPVTYACRQINNGNEMQTQSVISTKARISNHEDHSVTELLNGSVDQTATRTDQVTKGEWESSSVVDRHTQEMCTKGRVNGTRSERLQEPKPTRQAPVEGICICGESGASTSRTECGAFMCSECLDAVHIHCRVCHSGAKMVPAGIRGKITYSELDLSLPGHSKHATIKITYLIPDGVQQESHPSPGKPFKGGMFEAFLPDCERSRKLLPRLEDAFRRGLTFTVTKKKGSKVAWDAIPHKTNLLGGRSGNGYPDSSYLKHLSDVLTSVGIGERAAKS
ncbi:serine-rich adhesin for platelets [Entelurus aequoreus]|uniref:serine-rich adhesin for platelets n=1 Tax=Entelurus aequoreus TaxID=161455 RepID=UPI002B1D0B19|nr:serine-rich adhesin for platelets [Entelurus aequoreus]